MKTIRIFIGSTAGDPEPERAGLVRFVQGLNSLCEKRGVSIACRVCGETPRAATGCARCEPDADVFLVFPKADEYTLRELALARQAFPEKGGPRVYVFLKGPDPDEDIRKVMCPVSEDPECRCGVFGDADTLKLGLLQLLTEFLPGKPALTVKGGAFFLDGETVGGVSASKMSAYRNNARLAELKQNIELLRKQEALEGKNGDKNAALRLSVARDGLQKEDHTLETAILDALLVLHQQTRQPGKADPAMREALRHLELGEIGPAKALFPQKELNRTAKSLAVHRDPVHARLKGERLLSHTRVRIRLLKLDAGDPDRFSRVRRAYETACPEAWEQKDTALVYEYVAFLRAQKDDAEALRTAQRLKTLYDDPDNGTRAPDTDHAGLLDTLGDLYDSLSRPSEAEGMYQDALEMYRSFYQREPSPTAEDRAACVCKKLVNLHLKHRNRDSAEKCCLEALAICRRLAETVSLEAYGPDLAALCNDLGNYYGPYDRPDDTEKLHLEALDVWRRLVKTDAREAFERGLAVACWHLGNCYANHQKPDDAEKCYQEALTIFRRLAETVSSVAFEPNLARTCSSLGDLCKGQNKPDDAEKYYLESLTIWRRLAEIVGSEVFETEVASCCRSLGYFYAHHDREDDAEEFYLLALGILRRLAETVSREKYEPIVAQVLFHLYYLYYGVKIRLAEECHAEAKKIAEKYKDTDALCRFFAVHL